jgi:hypothetical protein
MSEDDKFDVKLEGDLNVKHLLGLIIELNGIRESEAQRKLQVDADKIHGWRIELEKSGLIEVDEELTDPQMRVTKKGLKELKDITKEWNTQSEEEEKKEFDKQAAVDKLKSQMQGLPLETSRKLKGFGAGFGMDLLIILSTLASLYLLYVFFQDPNVEVFSFLLGVVTLAFSIMLYSRYKKDLKTREFVGFVSWIVLKVRAYRQFIEIFMVLLLLIYFIGMYVLTRANLGLYVALSVTVASSTQLILSPKRSFTSVAKFYLGIVMLTFGLVLTVGMMSVTEWFLEQPMRVLDFGLGVGMLLLAYMNEKELGLSVGARKKP